MKLDLNSIYPKYTEYNKVTNLLSVYIRIKKSGKAMYTSINLYI